MADQMDDIAKLLAERGTTHGEYLDHSEMTQNLKEVMREGLNWDALSSHEKETLEMIAHKIGRILSGQHAFADHWDDIAGYAKLSADRVRPGWKRANEVVREPFGLEKFVATGVVGTVDRTPNPNWENRAQNDEAVQEEGQPEQKPGPNYTMPDPDNEYRISEVLVLTEGGSQTFKVDAVIPPEGIPVGVGVSAHGNPLLEAAAAHKAHIDRIRAQNETMLGSPAVVTIDRVGPVATIMTGGGAGRVMTNGRVGPVASDGVGGGLPYVTVPASGRPAVPPLDRAPDSEVHNRKAQLIADIREVDGSRSTVSLWDKTVTDLTLLRDKLHNQPARFAPDSIN